MKYHRHLASSGVLGRKLCGAAGLGLGIFAILACPASAEVLDKMPSPNEMMTTMFMVAFVGGIMIFFAFKFRLWAGVLTACLAVGLSSLLPDDDPSVKIEVLQETGRLFTTVYYGRWLLLIAAIATGFARWKYRQ